MCKVGKEEATFALKPLEGRENLVWEPQPGEVRESQVSCKYFQALKMQKKPATKAKAINKIPSARGKAEEEAQDQQAAEEEEEHPEEDEEEPEDQEEEEEEGDDDKEEEGEEGEEEDTGSNQREAKGEGDHDLGEDEEEEEEETEEENRDEKEEEEVNQKGQEEVKQSGEEAMKQVEDKRHRATKKRPASALENAEDFMVQYIYVVSACTGKNIRSYLLGKSSAQGALKRSRQIIQITPGESRKYEQLVCSLHREAEQKLPCTSDQLRSWASRRKAELLA